MKHIFTVLLFFGITAAHAQTYFVGHRSINFKDNTRSGGFSIIGGTTMPTGGTGRTIGTEVYYPATSTGDNTPFASGNFPLVVIGHGFAMTWDSYKTLTDSLVKNGYIVALPRTEGSVLPPPSHLDFGKDLAKVAELFAAQNTVTGSVFNGKHNGRTAIGGHSMGGGATFLADAFAPPSVFCYFTFAAAETNPKSSVAAKTITRPHLLFAGTYDCVTPPAQHQNLMWDSLLVSTCKTYINITKAYHCAFADNNFNCGFGEGTCITPGGYSSAAQQALVRRYLNPYLDYYLKGVCDSWLKFQNLLDTTTTASVQRVCNNNIPQNAAVTGSNTFCSGSSTTLTASPSGFSYQWTGGATTPTLAVSTAGSYSITVTNGVCAISSAPFVVNELTLPASLTSLTGSDTVCSGTSSLIYSTDQQSGVTYNWTLPSGWSIINGNNSHTIEAAPSAQSGTIEVSAVNTCGTSNTLSKTVTVLPSNLGTAGNITGNLNVCEGTTQTYSIVPVTGASNYVWTVPNGWSIQSGGGSNSIIVTANGSGNVEVSAQNYCGTSAPSNISVTVNTAPQLSGSILGPDTLCVGSTSGVYYAVNQASNATDYLWTLPAGWTFVGNGNTSAPFINLTVSGTLSVSASNSCGSSNTLQLPVTIVDTPQTSITQNGNILSASPTGAGYQYQWYYNGSPIGPNTATLNISANGDYAVVVTNTSTTCVGTSELKNVVLVSVTELTDQHISVFPNPSRGKFMLSLSKGIENGVISIYDLWGKVVHRQIISGSSKAIEMDTLQAGMYLLSVNTLYGAYSTRLVVE